jgi:hypothetical protein
LKAQLKQWPKSRVVMETGAEAFAMADAALEAGHEVRVVPCSLVRVGRTKAVLTSAATASASPSTPQATADNAS